jgi:hypothetical protein
VLGSGVLLVFVGVQTLGSVAVGRDFGGAWGTVFRLVMECCCTGPVAVGVYAAALGAVRGRATCALLFAGFRRYSACVGLYALVSVAGEVLWAPAQVAGGVLSAGLRGSTSWSATAWALAALGVVANAVVLLRMSFSFLAITDPMVGPPGAVGAVRASWRMTGGVWFGLAVLSLVLLGLMWLSAVAMVVPLVLVGMPVHACALAAAYERELRVGGG